MSALNLVLRFLLEVVALALASVWSTWAGIVFAAIVAANLTLLELSNR